MINTGLQRPKRNIWQVFFYSSDEVRLRAGWRLLLHTGLQGLISILAGIVIFIPIGILNISFTSPVALLAGELTMLIAITAGTFLARRFLDKRSIISLGLKPGFQACMDMLAGIAITFFQMGLVFGIELALGWTKFDGFAWQKEAGSVVLSGLGLWLLIFVIVGWQEELLSRGYHLQTIESGLNVFWAVFLSSFLFGSLHIFNTGATWISTLGISLAGLFLALPFILTRQLWLSIGLHIGWNFFEGVVFGFPVSGLDTFRLLRHTVSGPEMWTGGAFGPEAGLLLIPALLLGFLLIIAYTRSNLRKANLE
jgi:membrane protease YdiL (CAAX protease family)